MNAIGTAQTIDSPGLDVGSVFKNGWRRFVDDIGPLLLGTLIAAALTIVSLGILGGPLLAGLYSMVIGRVRDGRRPEVGDVFSGVPSLLVVPRRGARPGRAHRPRVPHHHRRPAAGHDLALRLPAHGRPRHGPRRGDGREPPHRPRGWVLGAPRPGDPVRHHRRRRRRAARLALDALHHRRHRRPSPTSQCRATRSSPSAPEPKRGAGRAGRRRRRPQKSGPGRLRSKPPRPALVVPAAALQERTIRRLVTSRGASRPSRPAPRPGRSTSAPGSPSAW